MLRVVVAWAVELEADPRRIAPEELERRCRDLGLAVADEVLRRLWPRNGTNDQGPIRALPGRHPPATRPAAPDGTRSPEPPPDQRAGVLLLRRLRARLVAAAATDTTPARPRPTFREIEVACVVAELVKRRNSELAVCGILDLYIGGG
jgi:hypothetical protein